VLFAHGSGSSRHGPRNRNVARVLNEAKLTMLLIDLLTVNEEPIDMRTGQLRFDIELLAERLVDATNWLAQFPDARQLQIGYLSASTGAAAVLVAGCGAASWGRCDRLARRPSRPGECGLAPRRAPTLLIVGGNDGQVIELNRTALAQMRCEKHLVIVPGATHLFEEPGALDEVARLARDWFHRHLNA
jgi:putative phosphoribosyl transferase